MLLRQALPKVDRPQTLQLTWIYWWQCFKNVPKSTCGKQTRARYALTMYHTNQDLKWERRRLSSHAFFLVAKWRHCRNPTNNQHHKGRPKKFNNSVTLFVVPLIIIIIILPVLDIYDQHFPYTLAMICCRKRKQCVQLIFQLKS